MSQDTQQQETLAGIEEVRGRLQSWRQERRAGQPMPQELWAEAVEMAARHGVYRVSKGLGLEFNKLKKLLEQRNGKPRRARGQKTAEFVELPASRLLGAPSAVAPGAVVELFGADGARLRISVTGPAAVDLPGLVAAFWRAERCCR
jgi:hypothetical protein